MRLLSKPAVMRKAAIAALITAAVCYPQIELWTERTKSIGLLCGAILWASFCLWSFAFAWHEEGAGSNIFLRKWDVKGWGIVTLCGIIAAILQLYFWDPHTRELKFVRFPHNKEEWGAMLLFTLVFEQLFICFAPYAFFIRLFRKRDWAAVQVVMFGVFLLSLKLFSNQFLIFSPLVLALFFMRIIGSSILVFLYIRGGIALVWWWTFLLEARHLLDFTS
jgi:hypothetical protein